MSGQGAHQKAARLRQLRDEAKKESLQAYYDLCARLAKPQWDFVRVWAPRIGINDFMTAVTMAAASMVKEAMANAESNTGKPGDREALVAMFRKIIFDDSGMRTTGKPVDLPREDA